MARIALIALWTLVGAWVLAEAAVRLLESPEPGAIVPSENPLLVYELNREHSEINRDGLRGREIDRDWLRDAFVIAAIGDSHTYSVRATSYETGYPAQLERSLRRRGHRRVTLLNFGVPGYNTAQELEVLRSRALAFEPDLVILQLTQNDQHVCNYIHPSRPALNRLVHRSHFLVWAWTGLLYRFEFGRERIFDFVARQFPDALLFTEGLVGTVPDAERAHPTADPAEVPARYHYMLGRENFEKHLREFGQATRDAGAAILATGFIEPEDETLLREAGFEVLPFSTIFRDVDPRRFGYRPDQTGDHFDDPGSAFIANALADFVERHYLAPQRRN